ncbi:MAG TPA: efflux RND transporter periplasmic adaptor subunit, partial [Candidatus Kapabacteria bacterium]|nr:efflux RND transporter periplasmic adaptor subunit [Candidatus Kapabacteria bacterium]
YTQIHAPIDGTVVSRNVDVGQTVAASLNAPVIFVIAQDLTKMQVQAAVDEADIGGVKPGQQVVFTVDAFGEEKFHGVVNSVRLNATITQNVVNYTVIIDADNSDLKLLPSMTATATIINQSKKDVLKVPMAALTFTPPDAQPGGGSGHRGGNRGGAANGGGGKHTKDSTGATKGTIYVKAPSKPGEKPAPLQLVHVQTGISDGLFIEVTPTEAINVGDSVAIGSSIPGAGAAGAPGASPFGTQPGGNRGGMRRL